MHVYKIIFAMNTILSCRLTDSSVAMKGDLIYQQYKGQLIYALIRADSERKAKEKAKELIQQFSGK